MFKSYNIRIYGNDGKLISDLKTDNEKQFLVSSKVLTTKQDIVMAAFYAEDRKRKKTNGLIVMRIDPSTGKVISNQSVPLSNAMISAIHEDDDDNKEEKREDDDEGIDANRVFHKFLIAPDNSLVVLAEEQRSWLVSYTTYSGTGASRSSTTTTYLHYECGDICMAKIAPTSKIDWFQTFPKLQRKKIPAGISSGNGYSVSAFYFLNKVNKPYYAGFGVASSLGKAYLIFNDNKKMQVW